MDDRPSVMIGSLRVNPAGLDTILSAPFKGGKYDKEFPFRKINSNRIGDAPGQLRRA